MTHIQYLTGNLFESNAQVIVNTVNCRGVMGKGLALAFKERYPEMFHVYQQECREGRLRIGRPTLYKKSTPWILNFPTKDNWRANSKLEYIEQGLQYFVKHYKEVGINSIAFPKLGAQNGKLEWDDVGPLMMKYLAQIDIPVYIYIAEGDTTYQIHDEVDAESKMRCIWEKFNEIALSLEKLDEELRLNKRDAKKIIEKRASTSFVSIADIENIQGFAKTSLKKVKDYIADQQYQKVELAGMPDTSTPQASTRERNNKSSSARSKKKAVKDTQVKRKELFPSLH